MNELRKKIAAFLEENREAMIADIQAFARIRSVSQAAKAEENAPFGPECRQMLDFALAHAKEMGFDTADHEGYMGSAILGDANNAIGIVGHLDVVPEGDQWVYPPYGATRVGDFLIGRGVSDNKSAVILGLYLMKFFRDNQISLKHGIRVLMGCSEETGMQDLHYYMQHYPEPLLTLVPDAAFPVNYAQKGSMSGASSIAPGEQIVSFTGGEVRNMVPPHARAALRGISAEKAAPFFGEGFTVTQGDEGAVITAQGVAAHAAAPEGGKSAILMLARALADSGLLTGQSQAAMEGVAQMCSDYYGANAGINREDPDTGKTTMVCGVAKMLKNGKISLSLDCRLSLASDQEADKAAYTAYANSLGFTVDQLKSTPPVYMDKNDPRVQRLTDLYADFTGPRLEPYTMGGGTYSRELTRSLTFGPGFPDLTARPDLPANHGGAHGPDEFMHIPSFLRAFELYCCAVKELDDILE